MALAQEILSAKINEITKSKDRILEISGIMLDYQKSMADEMVEYWFQEFAGFEEAAKKTAMLYVMNEVILKVSASTIGDEYLQAFSRVHPDIIENLVSFKSEDLLEQFRQLVQLWESNNSYITDYINKLKTHIQEAQNALVNERTGASVIQSFDITKRLEEMEQLKKTNTALFEKADALYQCAIDNKSGIPYAKVVMEEYRGNTEAELIETTEVLMALSEELKNQYNALLSLEVE